MGGRIDREIELGMRCVGEEWNRQETHPILQLRKTNSFIKNNIRPSVTIVSFIG